MIDISADGFGMTAICIATGLIRGSEPDTQLLYAVLPVGNALLSFFPADSVFTRVPMHTQIWWRFEQLRCEAIGAVRCMRAICFLNSEQGPMDKNYTVTSRHTA